MMEAQIWTEKSIIIVDDSKRMRDDLKIKYQEIGLTIVGEASNGLQAMELISQHMPDLVSIDIIMPEMNGFEVYERIIEISPKTLSFFVSCLATEQKLRDACQNKYDLESFFAKPLDPLVLKAWLGKKISVNSPKIKIAS